MERTNAYKRRLRGTVLHVTECSGGGVARAIGLAVKAASDYEHIILAPPGAIDNSAVGVRYVSLPNSTRDRIKAVGCVARDVGASLIHAHSSLGGFYSRIAKHAVPVLYQPHCYAFSDVTKPAFVRGVYWTVERLMTPRTTAVLALSEFESRQARRLGARTIYRIVNAPTITREPEHSSTQAQGGVLVVAMVGRITPQKDPAFFAAIARKFQGNPNVRFIWLGGTEPGEPSNSGHATLAASGVEITGWLADKELVNWLTKVDLYVHTAAYEGFPLSLLDACELGVASIARDIPSLAGSGLTMFASTDEAGAIVQRAIDNVGTLDRLRQGAQDLKLTHTIDVHDASVRAAYENHVPDASHPHRTSHAYKRETQAQKMAEGDLLARRGKGN